MGMDFDTGGGKKGRSRPSMNVTPLVDVVLVLLIIFMVVAPTMSKEFWLHLPDKPDDDAAASSGGQQPIVVSVTEDGQIKINRDVVADADLGEKLRGFLAARQTRKVFFDAHDAADFGRAVEVLDLARGAGAATIAVMTEPLPDSRR